MIVDWVPLWNRTLHNRKAQSLSGDVFKTWINLLCLASTIKRDGELPDVGQIAFELRLDEKTTWQHIDVLIAAGLVDSEDDETGETLQTLRVHDWNEWQLTSYKSTDRVRKHRERQKSKRASTKRVASNGTGETFHGVPGNGCNAIEEKRGEENREECVAPAHSPTEMDSGRTGEDHALFCRVVEDLEGFKETKYLAGQLLMYADTPEIRDYPSWRLFVASRVVQRPNRGKTWDTFCRAAFNATPEEYERLKRGPASGGKVISMPTTNQPPVIPADAKPMPDHMTRAEYEARRAKSR